MQRRNEHLKLAIRTGTIQAFSISNQQEHEMARLEDPTLLDLVDKVWDRRIPVDLADVAARLGIRIEKIHPGPGADISGEAFIDEASRKVVRYNPSDVPERQRFTLAHEIGHHLLGHTKNGKHFRDNTRNFNSKVFDWNEYSANAFAAELLMPETAVSYFIEKRGINDLQELAHHFQVSTVAMKYRLVNLGWL